jgi:hypothetical protein
MLLFSNSVTELIADAAVALLSAAIGMRIESSTLVSCSYDHTSRRYISSNDYVRNHSDNSSGGVMLHAHLWKLIHVTLSISTSPLDISSSPNSSTSMPL